MRPQVTEEQLKTLKLFAIYLQSYGAETATKTYYIENCDTEYEDDHFESPETNISIETYDKINEVLKEIVNINELIEKATTDCDLYGRLILEIDCVERILSARGIEWVNSVTERNDFKTLKEISDEVSEETYSEVLKIFEKIGENGEAVVRFQGSGDDGSLESEISINGNYEDISVPIMDMLYKWLEQTGIDWYNNEGGQGSFLFDSNNSEILLTIGINYEEESDVPLNFEIRF